MNFLKQTFLRIGIYILLAGFLAGFAWYKFFRIDTEDVIRLGGPNGPYYLKIKEFDSAKNIEIRIVKILNEQTNNQILVFEGGYKISGTCNQNVSNVKELMSNIEYYKEEENKIFFRNKNCYLEKN